MLIRLRLKMQVLKYLVDALKAIKYFLLKLQF